MYATIEYYSEYQYIQNIGKQYMEYQINKTEMLMTPYYEC